ncbi:MAG: hypothetical protein KatS3mg029_0635 [Saprospiraceae bacterium]|nr:MAG: hypothetical protein KatS3mg029_0635 [Saprospiraceae bacterium]
MEHPLGQEASQYLLVQWWQVGLRKAGHKYIDLICLVAEKSISHSPEATSPTLGRHIVGVSHQLSIAGKHLTLHAPIDALALEVKLEVVIAYDAPFHIASRKTYFDAYFEFGKLIGGLLEQAQQVVAQPKQFVSIARTCILGK